MLNLLKKPRAFYWFLQSFFNKNFRYILFSFLFSLLLVLYWYSGFFVSTRKLFAQENSIGIVGRYNLTNLPLSIQTKISFGLTKIIEGDKTAPAAGQSWEVKDNGKTYVFKLDSNLVWHDKSKLRSFNINYRLKDVEIVALGDNVVAFKLKEPFASLPLVLSQPLFKKGLVGLGDFQVTSLVWRGDAIGRIDLKNVKKDEDLLIYKFYNSEKEAQTALRLKKIARIEDLPRVNLPLSTFDFKILSETNYHSILTLFFNTQKGLLSEKLVRTGLAYAIPDEVRNNYDKAAGPIPKTSWYFNSNLKEFNQNTELAQKYLKGLAENKNSTQGANFKITIDTLPNYQQTAQQIKDAWNNIGIPTSVNIVNGIRSDYDVFLAAVDVSADPDQYYLWHSTQSRNISKLKSPRIDKLLEDARKTMDEDLRKKKYQEFQKFLVEEIPALFLFYTKSYSVSRL